MSKFKVGDWIVYVKSEDQTAYRIIEINENFYKIKEGKNELGHKRNLEPDLRLATAEEIKISATTKMNTKRTILGLEPENFKIVIGCLVIFLLWYNYSPFFDNPINIRIGALCEDGFNSNATGSGACSFHGGVKKWEYTQIPHKTDISKKIISGILFSFTIVFPLIGFLSSLIDKYLTIKNS